MVFSFSEKIMSFLFLFRSNFDIYLFFHNADLISRCECFISMNKIYSDWYFTYVEIMQL